MTPGSQQAVQGEVGLRMVVCTTSPVFGALSDWQSGTLSFLVTHAFYQKGVLKDGSWLAVRCSCGWFVFVEPVVLLGSSRA